MKRTKKAQLDGKKLQAENASQRSRGKYLTKPPEKLEYLIAIVNCLSPDGSGLHLVNPEALQANVKAEVELEGKKESESTFDVRLDAAACLSTKKVPSELRDYVWRGEWKGSDFHVEPVREIWSAILGKKHSQPVKIYIPAIPNAFRRYAEVWDAYEKLRGIAEAVRDSRQRWKLLKLGRYASIPASVQIDAQGLVRERKSLFSKA
jgi:hypothetical protein